MCFYHSSCLLSIKDEKEWMNGLITSLDVPESQGTILLSIGSILTSMSQVNQTSFLTKRTLWQCLFSIKSWINFI